VEKSDEFYLEFFLLSFCRLWPIDKGFTTTGWYRPSRVPGNFFLTDTSICGNHRDWGFQAYRVLEKLSYIVFVAEILSNQDRDTVRPLLSGHLLSGHPPLSGHFSSPD